MRNTPLTNEITVSEMRYMRDSESLSNAQIARKLNCSYQTVLKYLGPTQPHRKRMLVNDDRAVDQQKEEECMYFTFF